MTLYINNTLSNIMYKFVQKITKLFKVKSNKYIYNG